MTADSGGVIADPSNPPAEALDAIAAVDADVLCVALGNPKQERFIAASRGRLRTPVMIGIGGSLDLLVGVRRRAPQVVQRLALEWVYRAIQEPARLGPRYAKDIVVLGPTMARHILTARRSTRRADGGRLSMPAIAELVGARRQAAQLDEPFELRPSVEVAAQLTALRLGYLTES